MYTIPKQYLIILLILAVTGLVRAQNVNSPTITNIIPPSPEAQSFMRYGEIPVDVSTGVPDIQVPLYQIKSGKLSLPLAITYHASGIKVNDIASVVGLGWRLLAGGVLTKTVVGKPDNDPSYGMFNYPYLTQSQINALPQNGSEWTHLNMISKGQMDNGSDRYFYSVGDKLSGEFIYDHNFNVAQATYSDNSVISVSPTSYKVIGEDGTQYYFEACEYSQTNLDPQYISSWWLTKIVSADNADVITFTYQQYSTPSVVFTQSQSLTLDGTTSPVSFSGSQTNTYPMLLKTITFKNGYINFDYVNDRKDLQDNRLSQVSIYSNGSYTPLKTYQFSQSYFYSNIQDNKYNYRMKLDQIRLYDAAFSSVQNYSFVYDQNYQLPPYTQDANTNLPECYGQDYYGYFNGVGTNQHLISGNNGYLPSPYVAADRHVDYNYAKTGVLTQINYPTGGSTSFEYQINDGPAIGAQIGGSGLRVHRILSKTDPTTTATIKRYEYSNNLLQLDFDAFNHNSYEWYPLVYNSNCGYVNADYTTYSESPILPFANFHGGSVIYQNVDEFDDNSITNISLKKSYIYGADNDQIFSVNSQRYDNQYYQDCPWKKGMLLGLNSYKYNPSSGYVLKKSESYTYSDFRDNSVVAGTMIERTQPLLNQGCSNFSDQYASGYTYQSYFTYFDIPIETGIRKQTGMSATEFDDNGNGVTSSQSMAYASPYNLFPTQKSVNSSTGDNWITQYKYPADFVSSAPYSDMVNTYHIWSPVIEQLEYKNTTSNFLQSTLTNYGVFNSNAAQIYPSLVQTKKGTGSYENRIQYNTYDVQGNVTSVSKSGGPSTSYQWGYNKTYPVAQTSNASSNEFFYEGFEESTIAGVQTTGGHTGHNYLSTGGYTTGFTPPNSRAYMISYWSNSGGGWVFSGPMAYTGQTLSGSIDDVRIYPADALMTTYSYDPLTGMTSSTDAKGETTYYEYDTFQRLMNIKDKDGNITKHIDYHYQNQ